MNAETENTQKTAKVAPEDYIQLNAEVPMPEAFEKHKLEDYFEIKKFNFLVEQNDISVEGSWSYVFYLKFFLLITENHLNSFQKGGKFFLFG